jgi:mannitol-1-phosphate 5-dehydrogenase
MSMPILVQIGAGNIGRGFVAPLFTASGWEVVFVDVNQPLVEAVNQRRRYQVTEVDNEGSSTVMVAPVRALHGDDRAAVAAVLASADLVATAVGLSALPCLGGLLAAAAQSRGSRPLDILVCENGLDAHEQLRAAVAEVDVRAADRLGFVRTSIGKMIPAPEADADLLDIAVEPYGNLPVERAAFRGAVPAVRGIDAAEDFELIIRQKLYLHNLTHASLAYSGARKGYTTIAECVSDSKLASSVRSAGFEAAEALARAHGRSEVERARLRRENRDLVEDLLQRYSNRRLHDPVARVGRDPWRKLAADDRVVGAARLCLAQGVHPTAIFRHLLDACAWQPQADDPQAQRWRDLQARGPLALITAITGLPRTDPVMQRLRETLHDQRRHAAVRTLKAAGVVVMPTEAATLEIADYGLDRCEQFGLAILVYVNTERCCAQELVMTPAQICPEHRHPPVAGEVGKEATLRCRFGEVHLFVPGHKLDSGEKEFALRLVPADKHATLTMFKHIHLTPGGQYTLPPNTLHWFVAGPQGAVISAFSTRSRDEADIFTDPDIRRFE